MSDQMDPVRPSRDGDQFHYSWAARRCVGMLKPGTDLVAVVIEGVPKLEQSEVAEGVEVIDVAEYRGAIDLDKASGIRYLQLKHSTVKADKEWTASGLKKTLGDFAARYTKLVARFGASNVAERFRFGFVTNRPLARSLTDALGLLAAGTRNDATAALEKIIGLSGTALPDFAALVDLEGQVSGYIEQRNLLARDLGAYLPDRDRDAPVQLKELVTRRATSEYQGRPEITRLDVLESLNIEEADLFPAPPLFDELPFVVDRAQMADIADTINAKCDGPIIIHADGGVGKSVVATRIAPWLPSQSVSFLYDCFGNGAYRSATGYRHRVQDGLVQIANEMAAELICDPLIPAGRADPAAYIRAFMARVHQASETVALRSKEALVAIIVDAADNAQMAADEILHGSSFARLLLRETFPTNVRLVMTARSHRIEMLDPPPGYADIELDPFSEAETEAYLKKSYPAASKQEVREFHRLTSMNPRVQATALSLGGKLSKILSGLGPEPLTVKDTIAMLLEAAIAKLRDEAPGIEKARIDEICVALATLRPFVPLDIVAKTADVPVALVRSMANDLQRPLLVRDDSIQFRDEPTETWFRERFRPQAKNLKTFVERLLPLATRSAYVAAGLPQLMLEAGEFDALVELALRGEALPEEDELVRRDVEHQRLQFALKAALRARRFVEASKLAVLAGGKAAADDRQQRLLSENSDLGALFLEPDQILEQVSRRLIRGGGWTGSEHAYEAAFLSGIPALAGDGASRLRVAYEWLGHWARAKGPSQARKEVSHDDVAELALADFNLHGAAVCTRQLRRWRHRERSYFGGQILVSRLVDAARFSEIDELAEAAGNDLGLLLAICRELARVGRVPPAGPVRRAVRLVTSRHVRIRDLHNWQGEVLILAAVNALIFAAIAHRAAPRATLAKMLTRYLPKWPPNSLDRAYAGGSGERETYLRAYALRAGLRNHVLRLEELEPKEAQLARRRKKSGRRPDLERFNAEVGALLPWHLLWVDRLLGRLPSETLGPRVGAAAEASRVAQRSNYRERSEVHDEIAKLRCQSLYFWPSGDENRSEFDLWLQNLEHPLYIPTWVDLARVVARVGGQERRALDWAGHAYRIVENGRDHAQMRAESCIAIVRAILPASRGDASAYFDNAVRMSASVGDENLWRWDVMLNLADRTGQKPGHDEPELAYRFARAAEFTYALVDRDKHFDWEFSVQSLTKLSPRSAPAIVSRWLDRDFGQEYRLLPTFVEQLVEDGHLSPVAAAALFPMGGRWDRLGITGKALATLPDIASRQDLFDLCQRYMELRGTSASEWSGFVALGEAHRLEISHARSIVGRALKGERDGKQRKTSPQSYRRRFHSNHRRRLARTFDALDLTTADGLIEAYRRYRAGKTPYDWEAFSAAAMARVPVGREGEFLDVQRAVDDMGLYRLSIIYSTMPADWQQRASVRPALQRLTRDVVRRECSSIGAGNYYQMLDWNEVERLSGLNRLTLSREAVVAAGDHSAPLEADDLFRLAGLLSMLMAPDEAGNSLDYCLTLYNPMLRAEDGDGPWRPELSPPTSIESALAGFLWRALSSPWTERRWKAAHAVRSLLRLRRDAVVDHLIGWADAKASPAFGDARFQPYDWNGLQWLMIAFARATLESGEMMLRHVDFLKKHASIAQSHIVIRAFARRTLELFAEQGRVILTPDEHRDLVAPIVPVPHRSAPATAKPKSHRGKRRRKGEDRFLFGIDFEPYWINPLARQFDIDAEDIEEEMERIIRKDWGLSARGHWNEDARASAGQFDDRGMDRSQGSIPAVEDLSFYLSYHSLMITAGDLLRTTPLRVPDFDEGGFDAWIEEQLLTRSDGLWLSDRRDPTPADLAFVPDVADADWPSSHGSNDIRDVLRPDAKHWAIGGYWHRYAGKRSERVAVTSSLVTPDRAHALARALILTNGSDYRLPDVDDGFEIDKYGYVMKGWLGEIGSDRRLDRRDPWAANIGSRDHGPGAAYAELLCLMSSGDGRRWRDGPGKTIMLSQIWSEGQESEDVNFGGGRRLTVDRAALRRFLRTLGMSLVVEVRIKRDFAYNRYDYEKKDRPRGRDIRQIFVIEKAGSPWCPRSAPSTR